MQRQDKVLRAAYAALSVGALIATWSQNIAFFATKANGGLIGFIKGVYANPAAASFSNDLIIVFLAAILFMIVEARRLGIPRVWIYVVLGFTIAISVAFPAFLFVRQGRIASLRSLKASPE